MPDKLLDAKHRVKSTNPEKSLIVQAPAGSGKTSLLVERYLNLLNVVEKPEQILALTFTRKAAHEMRYRVLERLTKKDSQSRSLKKKDETLHWNLSQNTDRLKIQTIDSFAYSVIQQLPLANRFGIEYRLTDDPKWLYLEAATQLLENVSANQPLAMEIASYMAKLDNNFDLARDLLVEMLGRREQWIGEISSVMGTRYNAESSHLIRTLEQSIVSLRHRLVDVLQPIMHDELLSSAQRICKFSAETLKLPFNNFSRFEDWLLLCEITTTNDGSPRKRLDRRNGFPPDSDKEKAICKQLIAKLVEMDLIGLLGMLRHVPSPEVSDNEKDTLTCFATILTLSVIELLDVFKRHKTIDFPEVTLTAQRALGSEGMPSELALALDYEIKHILIDEFQDTSLAQYRFITHLISGWDHSDKNTFFAVGDPMQSVYRFRDADVSLFSQTFKGGFEQLPLESETLVSNFRSSSELVEYSNRIFSKLFSNPELKAFSGVNFSSSRATVDKPGTAQLVICKNDSDQIFQAKLICDRIKLLRRTKPDDTIALLARTRSVLANIFIEMRNAGLTWNGIDIEPLSNIPVVRDLYALTRAIEEPNNRIAWLSVLRSPLVGLELRDLEIINALGSMQQITNAELSTQGKKRVSRLENVLQKIDPYNSLRQKTETLWITLGGADAFPDENSLSNAYKYFDLLEKKYSEEQGLDRFFELIANSYNSDTQSLADVQIMTVHKAKGLEFDHVLVIGAEKTTQIDRRPLLYWKQITDGLLMASRTQEQKPNLYEWLRLEQKTEQSGEDIRLLYVAFTRAISSISVYASHDGEIPPRGSFLAMLLPFFPSPIVKTNTFEEKNVSLITPNHWTRLKEDYIWHPPITLPQIKSKGIFSRSPNSESVDASSDIRIDILKTRREIGLGILIHEELFVRTRNGLLGSPLNLKEWTQKFHSDGFSATDIDWICTEASRQLNVINNDSKARWFLSSDRIAGESETNYTAYLENQLVDIQIDRTFIDNENIRWIIDYKSAVGINNEQFLNLQISKHRSQLIRYGRVMEALDRRSQKLAIYLTSIGKLVEIT